MFTTKNCSYNQTCTALCITHGQNNYVWHLDDQKAKAAVTFRPALLQVAKITNTMYTLFVWVCTMPQNVPSSLLDEWMCRVVNDVKLTISATV